MSHKAKLPKKIFVIFLVFFMGLCLRWFFAPKENMAADSFELIAATKNLSQTGEYLMPTHGAADLKETYEIVGWPVGYPLMLCGVSKVFGHSENAFRLFTILLSSCTVIFVILIADVFFGYRAAILGGLLMAAHPLLVAFNGRIFTNNPAVLFLYASLAFLVYALVEKDSDKAEVKFVDLSSVCKRKKRAMYLIISFLLLGYLLAIRDTMAMFLPVYFLFFYRAGLFNFKPFKSRFLTFLKLLPIGIFPFILGFLPSMYFNYKNYGTLIASSHYKWGVRLSLSYLLLGRGSTLGIPGALVIIITGAVYCFPLVALLFIDKVKKEHLFFLAIFACMLIPITLINGSFFVSSTGASPRYTIPLVPIACILTATSLLNMTKSKAFLRVLVIFVIAIWYVVLTYPMPFLFNLSPKFAYLAHYSPVYQIKPYENYPSHTNAVSRWVKQNTPDSSIIIVPPSNPYHFYYYANRDIVFYSNFNQKFLLNYINKRSIFLAEDHEATYNPVSINKVKDVIRSAGVEYYVAGEVKLFSPKVGHTVMRIYGIKNQTEMNL